MGIGILVLPTMILALLIMTVHGFTKESHRGSGIIGASQWRRTPTCIEAFFEDEDCEDLCPNEEPTFKVQVENAPKPKRRELRPLWWVGTDDVEKCSTCNGTGEQICRFCQGTRFLSGVWGNEDALLHEGIGKDCPVCKDGVEPCTECSSTGFILSRNKPNEVKGRLPLRGGRRHP